MTGKTYGTREKVIAAFTAFLAVAGFSLLYEIRKGDAMFSNSVFCIAAFGAFSLLTLHILNQNPDRRTLVYGLTGGFLAAVMTCMGYSLNYTDTIWHGQVLGRFCVSPHFSAAV